MKREQLDNKSETSLDGAIDASTTTVDVTDGSVFPSDGDFRIAIDATDTSGALFEIVRVTARSTNTLTVVRAVDGTTGVAHATGASVRLIATEDGFEQYIQQNTNPYHNYSPALRVYTIAGLPTNAAGFTWVNQGTATADDVNNSILLKIPADAGVNLRGMELTAPSPPYAIIGGFHVSHLAVANAAGQPRAGLILRESGTGELYSFFIRKAITDIAGVQYNVQRWTNTTTFSAEQNATLWTPPSDLVWLKIEDDNTDLNFSISEDGVNWVEIFSEGRTTFMAGGPDRIGFGANASDTTAAPWLYVHHFGIE